MKRTKRLSALLLVLVLAAGILVGCGSKKPTAENAKDYVKAALDIICTGDYDHSVKFADMNTEEAKKTREELLDGVEESLTGGETELPEETVKKFRSVMDQALRQCRYSVNDAVAADDGFDVTVTIEPLLVMDSSAITNDLMEHLMSIPNVTSMTQDEIMVTAMDFIVTCIEKNVKTPVYGDPVELTVHYGLLKDNRYGVSEEDGQRLGAELLISR